MSASAEEGRLELDDSGAVVEAGGAAPASVVDLDDDRAAERLPASRMDSWVSDTAGPWMRRHRRPLTRTAAATLAVALGVGWWTSRPAPPPPPPLLALADARLAGADAPGLRVTPDGRLSVAFSARPNDDEDVLDVVGLSGPGLTSSGVEDGADTVVAGRLAYVRVGASISCDDPAIASAGPSSYGLLVRVPGADPGEDRLVAFDSTTARVDVAVRETCLATNVPSAVSALSADLTGIPGSTVAALNVRVRNESDLPLTVASQRTPSTTVETDLSSTVTLAPHSAGTLSTLVLAHDCGGRTRPAALTELPNPVIPAGYADPQSMSGLTVRLGLGDRSTVASYALPWTVAQLGDLLGRTSCAGAPAVSAQLLDVSGSRSMDGSWLVEGSLDVRSLGVALSLGREHFVGPAAGAGSSVATTDSLVPGERWVLTPTQLGTGSGRLPVTFSGLSCDERDRGIPTSLAVRVTMADQRVYPFEVPLDAVVLRAAVDRACSPGALVQVPDWGTVTPGATPAA